ncbi:Aste57867_4144 [Aphanomyces stellatus]|uniref:Aste57867_4144 protein n=1 Tax=Aphanomyces stellatus TaxID=120398 RepID=A0A485KFF9_9STRA|nr:hypothetical protein As57867_004133 [Aphanomyces stellatus]VFT81271.1 Aste57867_4144 [Aphanomyces stellatus]
MPDQMPRDYLAELTIQFPPTLSIDMKLTALASLVAVPAMAQTHITVNFPGNSGSEYTIRAPANLLACKSNTWNIGGSTYDGVTSCSVNSKAKISVIPFRCGNYTKKTNTDGINECDRCYYGWGEVVNGQIDPFWSQAEADAAKEPLSMYFVPQTISSLKNLRSCLMVSDKGLATLCDNVVRKALSSAGSAATCVKGSKSTPFAKPLSDNDRCAHYKIVNNQVVCQP